MKKRLLAGLLSTVMVATLLSGCGSSTNSSSSAVTETKTTENTTAASADGQATEASIKQYDGTTITLSCASTPYIGTIIKQLDEFTKLTGITVEIDQLENDQLSNKIAVSSAAGGSDLDVIAYRPIQENKKYIANGWLEPLSDYISKSADWDLADYTDSAKSITSDKDGNPYGVALVTEREILYFNTELLKAAGYTEGPKNFDELLQYCEKLNDPEHGVYALGLRGEGNSAVTQFSGFLYGFGGDFIVDGKAALNTPEFIKALQFYGKLCREYCPEGVLNAGWQETSTWFTQGTVAMRIDADSQYSYALDPANSLISDKVGYSILPGSADEGSKPYSIVAWALGISSNSANKGAAWEFIKWATSKDMDLKAQQEGNFSARNSTWADPSSTADLPAQLVSVVDASNKVAMPYDRPYMKDVGEARTAIGELITKAIEGISDADLQTACDAVNATVQQLLDKETA